jgi:hypothetical protein
VDFLLITKQMVMKHIHILCYSTYIAFRDIKKEITRHVKREYIGAVESFVAFLLYNEANNEASVSNLYFYNSNKSQTCLLNYIKRSIIFLLLLP